MKRQILRFTAALLGLCALLTIARLVAGVDYARLSTVVHLPIVWAMTLGEVGISLGCYVIAWHFAWAYNTQPQSAKSFPKLSRAVAFSLVALGTVAMGDAVCHWVPMYWSLAAVKLAVGGVLLWAGNEWRRGAPELVEWFRYLRVANGLEKLERE